jgi:hypothetical protein
MKTEQSSSNRNDSLIALDDFHGDGGCQPEKRHSNKTAMLAEKG